MAICLDSTVIIDFLKGQREAISIIQSYEQNSLIATEISVFEVFVGIYLKEFVNAHEIAKATDFFSSLPILYFDDSCGQEAALIHASLSKKGAMVEQGDIFISAIMRKNNCNEIITRNVKDYSRIEGIKAIGY